MAEIFSLGNLSDLTVLIFLQAVLGFDNLLYISIESRKAPAKDQKRVRRTGILIAIGLRVILLFLMMQLIGRLKEPFFGIHWTGWIEGEFNFSSIVFLLGGAFIMYTAVKEITHMLSVDKVGASQGKTGGKTAKEAIAMIVFMNLVFSFDSILSAIAISQVFAVLAVAVISSGLAMLLLADEVSVFLEKNKHYEVLGLFILLIVGVVLLGEGGHIAHLHLAGHEIVPMSKSTFYFSVIVLVIVDLLQSRYQKKLSRG